MRRLGEMSEVAAAVSFLASEDAAFINATDLKVHYIHHYMYIVHCTCNDVTFTVPPLILFNCWEKIKKIKFSKNNFSQTLNFFKNFDPGGSQSFCKTKYVIFQT